MRKPLSYRGYPELCRGMPFPPPERKKPPSIFFLNAFVAVILAYLVGRWLFASL